MHILIWCDLELLFIFHSIYGRQIWCLHWLGAWYGIFEDEPHVYVVFQLNWTEKMCTPTRNPFLLHSTVSKLITGKAHVKLLLANVQPQLPLTSLCSSERHTLKPFCSNRCGQSCQREIGGTAFGEVGGEEHGGGYKWVEFLVFFSYNLWAFMKERITYP